MSARARLSALLCSAALALTAAPAASADTGGEVQRAKDRAAQLSSEAGAQAQAAAAAQNRLLQLSALANAALAQAEATTRAVESAKAQADAAAAKLTADGAAAATAREQLSDYARHAYIAGGRSGQLASMASLLETGSATEMLDGLALLDQVGGSMNDTLLGLQTAERDQAEAAQQAQVTAEGLRQAERDMRAAHAAAVRAVARQRQVLADAKARAAAFALQAAQARRTSAALEAELAAEIAANRAQSDTGGGQPQCKGEDISGYPNGQIPMELLCPLYGAPGEALRKDAATQFNAMSKAYEQQFGTAICVADSYRSYERQQQIAAERPGYAATPGTSEHGWARAVDLCGGIQTDGTPQNTWMRLNAAQFNWFHPGWADSGGGGPYEPWHWEYAG